MTQVVVAAPPTADFTISDSTLNLGQSVTFTSTSTDDDNDIATYEWDLDYDGGSFDPTATGASATTSYGTAGTYVVALRVTDGIVNETPGTADSVLRLKPVTVSVPNANPTGSFTFTPEGEVGGAVPDVGQSVTFDGSGTDPDGDSITFEWSFGDGGTATGEHTTHTFTSAGPKTVTMTVRDNRGGTGQAQQTVTVNAPPVANINILNPQAEAGQKHTVPLAGQAFAFTANAVPQIPGSSPAPGCPAGLGTAAAPGSTDAAPGTITTYEWDLDGTPGFEVTGASASVPSPAGGYPAGPRTARLRVTDDDGGSDTAELTFRVNTPPTTQFVYEPFTPIINQETTFSSTSTDPDAAEAGKHSYVWDLDDDGTFCEAGEQGASVKRSFPTANTTPGHRVRLRVTDDGGITREATRNVFVQNTIPTGAIGFSPGAPLPGEPVTFTGSASSPTGKAIASIQWDFDFDPAAFNLATDQFEVNATGASVSHAFSSAGSKTIGLRIQEAGGGFAIVTRTITVNAAPQAGFTVAPQSAFVGDTVTLSSTSSDPDGPLTKQEWDLDNDGAFDDANAAVVSANFQKRGTYPVGLRVTDSRGATSTATGQVTLRSRPLALLSGVVISLKGLPSKRSTKVTRLLVRAPRGSKVSVRCRGKGCPKRGAKTSKGSKRLRFKKLERKFRPGTKLIVTVTRSGFIGKQTTFTIRRRAGPRRRDLCLTPGAKRAKRCPPE